jgi:hypothetical protein
MLLRIRLLPHFDISQRVVLNYLFLGILNQFFVEVYPLTWWLYNFQWLAAKLLVLTS